MIRAILLLAPFFCSPSSAFQDTPTPSQPDFIGVVEFTQSIEGGEESEWAKDLIASKIRVTYGAQHVRMDRDQGLQEGSVIIPLDSKKALRLDHKEYSSELGSAYSLDRDGDDIREFMPDHFATKLEAMEGELNICGHKAKKYKIIRSAFVAPGAEAYLWIAEDLKLPRRRFQCEFPSGTVVAPLPLSIPVDKGSVVRTQITERSSCVTTTVSSILPAKPGTKSALAADIFRKPEGYVGPELPTASSAKATIVPESKASEPVDFKTLAPRITTAQGIELVLVAPTQFQMGSESPEPGRHSNETAHRVSLTSPYYIATTEVTQAQWLAIMGEESPSNFKGDELPVESITWDQANAFCERLSKLEGRSFRLPTEAEWELAARAGESVDLASMKNSERKARLQEIAWTYFNADYETHPVGMLKPNAWGLYDTLGNVGEWCLDGYAEFSADAAHNPQGVTNETKTTRGAGWIANLDACRAAARNAMDKAKSKSTVGLRIVAQL